MADNTDNAKKPNHDTDQPVELSAEAAAKTPEPPAAESAPAKSAGESAEALTEKKEAGAGEEAPSSTDKSSVSPAASLSPTKPPASKIGWFASVLALIALGLSGFLAWQLLLQQDNSRSSALVVEEHHQQIQSLTNSLASQQLKLDKQLAQRDTQIASLRQSLVDAQLSIDAHSRRMLALTATTTDDWRLAEVEYLLRLANQRLLTSKDADTALELLAASDQILLELANPRLFKVRKAIADDKAAVAAVGDYDIEGTFLELAALSNQVNQLQSLLIPAFVPGDVNAASGEVASATSLPAWLQPVADIARSTWDELKALIVIRQVDTPVKPLLPPEQEFYLKSNLRLLLSQAQLALLDGRQQAYRQSLQSAAAWVAEFFPQAQASNKAMYEALARLAALTVTAEYPDVSESLLAIRAFIEEQHRLSAGVQAAEEGETAP